jgi:hypothetical protein
MLADTVTPISWLLVYTILSSMIGEGNLMRLSDDEISRQIGSRTRAYLDGILVNGGIF